MYVSPIHPYGEGNLRFSRPKMDVKFSQFGIYESRVKQFQVIRMLNFGSEENFAMNEYHVH